MLQRGRWQAVCKVNMESIFNTTPKDLGQAGHYLLSQRGNFPGSSEKANQKGRPPATAQGAISTELP